MKPFSIIVAMDDAQGIGKANALPWRLSADLKRFKILTIGDQNPGHQNAVLMGRKTWESLPEKSRPLPGRLNVVLTHQKDLPLPAPVLKFSSLDNALAHLSQDKSIEEIFVIGGAQIYTQSVNHPACRRLLVTRVQGNFTCDAFFPHIPARFKKVQDSGPLQEGEIHYSFVEYAA